MKITRRAIAVLALTGAALSFTGPAIADKIIDKGVRVNFWQGISVTDESGDTVEVLPVGPGEIDILRPVSV
jgi:hypothetical protein